MGGQRKNEPRRQTKQNSSKNGNIKGIKFQENNIAEKFNLHSSNCGEWILEGLKSDREISQTVEIVYRLAVNKSLITKLRIA